MEAWREEPETTVEEVIGNGDHVVVIACFRGRGRGSGVRVAERLYEVYTLRTGKVLRVDEFSDRDQALEAAGLRE
jgi:ketosteroid isomerase-like protein